MRSKSIPFRCVAIALGILLSSISAGFASDNTWLELPGNWSRASENGVIHASPKDLKRGKSLLMMVDPVSTVKQSIQSDFTQALTEFPKWLKRPTCQVQSVDSGWSFCQGVGAVEIEGQAFTIMVSIARKKDLRARFWTLSESDATMNQYMPVVSNAIASVQDYRTGSAAVAASKPAAQAPPGSQGVSGFGQGISGVYVGLERGLTASAGVGPGTQLNYNAASGRIENQAGMGGQVQTSISDYVEVDVFYPDGTYRRRMPVRGMASDLNWERQQQAILWGTWQRQGDTIVARRGNYETTYRIQGKNLISERGQTWQKLALSKNQRINARFVRDDYRGANVPSLTLHADGTYVDYDEFLRMIGSTWNLVVPDADRLSAQWSDAQTRHAMSASSGTYTFEQHTLSLHTQDGRLWQFNAYIPPGENMSSPNRIVINGRMLVKE